MLKVSTVLLRIGLKPRARDAVPSALSLSTTEWQIDDLFRAFPNDWAAVQEITFADSQTYPSYNANMRSLVVDKLKTCDAVMFNRMTDGTDKAELHKIVRSVGRITDILYDYGEDRVEPDDIVDPLPFDIDAPVIEIGDSDYALWFSDLLMIFRSTTERR